MSDYKEQLAEVHKHSDVIGRMLRQPMADWETTKNIAANLKRLLALWLYFLRLRSAWSTVAQTIAVDADRFRDRINPRPHSIRVETYGTGWNQGRCNSVEIDANDLLPMLPNCDEYAEHKRQANAIARIAKQLDQFYRQFRELHDNRPEYRDIKKKLPVGGRAALSLLKVCDEGKQSRNMSNQNELFGFSDDTEVVSSLLAYYLRRINPRQVERGGKAPSFAGGCRLHVPYHSTDRRYNPSLADRLRSFRGNCNQRSTLGEFTSSPTLLKISNESGYRHAKRMLDRLSGSLMPASHTTVIVSRPERIGGDDYECQAIWLEETNARYTATGKTSDRNIIRGWIYCRTGWNDCFHSAEHLDPQAAHAQLDRSSEWHFKRLQSEAERRLSRRQRQARTLRRLRAVACVTVEDSYQCGNCRPGTTQFLHQLGINETAKTGRELAALWRSKQYPSFDRFEPVLAAAEKRISATVDSFYHWAIDGYSIHSDRQLSHPSN